MPVTIHLSEKPFESGWRKWEPGVPGGTPRKGSWFVSLEAVEPGTLDLMARVRCRAPQDSFEGLPQVIEDPVNAPLGMVFEFHKCLLWTPFVLGCELPAIAHTLQKEMKQTLKKLQFGKNYGMGAKKLKAFPLKKLYEIAKDPPIMHGSKEEFVSFEVDKDVGEHLVVGQHLSLKDGPVTYEYMIQSITETPHTYKVTAELAGSFVGEKFPKKPPPVLVTGKEPVYESMPDVFSWLEDGKKQSLILTQVAVDKNVSTKHLLLAFYFAKVVDDDTKHAKALWAKLSLSYTTLVEMKLAPNSDFSKWKVIGVMHKNGKLSTTIQHPMTYDTFTLDLIDDNTAYGGKNLSEFFKAANMFGGLTSATKVAATGMKEMSKSLQAIAGTPPTPSTTPWELWKVDENTEHNVLVASFSTPSEAEVFMQALAKAETDPKISFLVEYNAEADMGYTVWATSMWDDKDTAKPIQSFKTMAEAEEAKEALEDQNDNVVYWVESPGSPGLEPLSLLGSTISATGSIPEMAKQIETKLAETFKLPKEFMVPKPHELQPGEQEPVQGWAKHTLLIGGGAYGMSEVPFDKNKLKIAIQMWKKDHPGQHPYPVKVKSETWDLKYMKIDDNPGGLFVWEVFPHTGAVLPVKSFVHEYGAHAYLKKQGLAGCPVKQTLFDGSWTQKVGFKPHV